MKDLNVGTIAIVYGLINSVELNGKCVTLLCPIPMGTKTFICPITGKSELILGSSPYNGWYCDDMNLYRSQNLLPIGNKDNDFIKNKESEYDN